MSYAFPREIKLLIEQNMATGKYASEEDVLQAALHALSDYHATIADIRQGIIDYEQGRGEPPPEAMADVRQQLGSRLEVSRDDQGFRRWPTAFFTVA
jgi:Arc/MetJ-type ribon-helix-helix transcriptional regulator